MNGGMILTAELVLPAVPLEVSCVHATDIGTRHRAVLSVASASAATSRDERFC
jgi:hypothetical protein